MKTNYPTCLLIIFLLFSGKSISQDSPGLRNAHSMVYHEQDSAIYLFGGASDVEVLSDLWKWKGGKWYLVSADGPPARTFASMVYDPVKNRIVLFGGSKVLFGRGPHPDNMLQDTWVFENYKWRQIEVELSPPARAEAGVAFDREREKLVLFGGYQIKAKTYVPLGDTWELNDLEWKMVSNEGPARRNNPAMTYDPTNRVVVLFGGSTGKKGYGEGKGETWTWDGEAWEKLAITQPENMFNTSMVNTTEGIFRFGGWDGQERRFDSFLLTEKEWVNVQTNSEPHQRNHAQMIFETPMNRVILYGGHDGQMVFGDMWSYRDGRWKKLSQTPPRTRARNGH